MMRWALVWSTSTGLGGTERRSIAMTEELTRRGHRVTSLHRGPEHGRLVDAMRAAGATVVTTGRDAGLTRLILQQDVDIVWHMGLRAGLAARASKAVRRGPRLWSAQNGLDATRGWLLGLADRATLRLVDLVVANSDAAAEHAVAVVHAPPSKVVTVQGGLTKEWSSRGERRPHHGPVRIAMVGNSRPEKRQELGIAVVGALHDPEVTLTVFTDDAAALQQSLRDSPFASPVRLHVGHRVEPDDLRQIDVLLHPSSSESLPVAVLEARSQGCFVVAAPVGDTQRFATHVVQDAPFEAWVAATRRAVNDVRAGRAPDAIQVRTTADYVDDILALAQGSVAVRPGARR